MALHDDAWEEAQLRQGSAFPCLKPPLPFRYLVHIVLPIFLCPLVHPSRLCLSSIRRPLPRQSLSYGPSEEGPLGSVPEADLKLRLIPINPRFLGLDAQYEGKATDELKIGVVDRLRG